MTERITNDNELTPGPSCGNDSHGRAAMLLIESLVHGLIARTVISANDAVEIVHSAAEIEREFAYVSGDAQGPAPSGLGMLVAIERTLMSDAPLDGRPEV